MRSPEDMRCIQIDITNACIHNCSNCTRLCGHHKKPYFMSWDTFKRAVDSLEGFEGEIGIMGGEPTLHPEFERFAEYLNSKYENPKKDNYFIRPTKHFMRDRKLEERNLTYTYKEKNGLGQRIKGPALWSSLASNYYKYYETIQDIFRYQCVNDHITPCFHQPILVSRRDMGISDKEWKTLRDNCWMQNVWSASITPKGCFFCEVAGALDMLFDGNGGWPIEKDWWKRRPEDFTEQLHWCEFCGVALNTRSRNANDGIDDVSESMIRELEKIKSPGFRKGRVHLYTKEELPEDARENRKYEYHDNNMNRVSNYNHTIYCEYFPIILMSGEEDTAQDIEKAITHNISQTKKMIVFVNEKVEEAIRVYVERLSCQTEIIVMQDEGNYGRNLNKAHKLTDGLHPNVILTSGTRLEKNFGEELKQYVINPGTYHYLDNHEGKCSLVQFEKTNRKELFILYSPHSKALRRAGYDGIARCTDSREFSDLWDDSKKVIFDNELLEGRTPANTIEYETGCKYVIFGTGTYGKKAFEDIKKMGAEVVFCCDSSPDKQGCSFYEVPVYGPKHLQEDRGSFDKVVIAALAYHDIREKILENGVTDKDIVAPIF